MSFGDRVLGPAYLTWGRDAVLTVSGVDYSITAIDKTDGVAVTGDLMRETIMPAAAVRAADLAAHGLIPTDLDDAVLSLDGEDWRITSVRSRPSPEGIADGEYLLLLEQATASNPI